MSSDASTLVPPSGPSPGGRAVSFPWSRAAECSALALAFLALVGCLVSLLIFTAGSVWHSGGAATPAYTGEKEEYQKLSYFISTESYRQQVRMEYRVAVTQSAAYLAATALAFLAVALFLRPAGMPAEGTPPGSSTAWGWLARVTPGLVALLCATLIFIFTASRPTAPPPLGVPVYSSFSAIPAAPPPPAM